MKRCIHFFKSGFVLLSFLLSVSLFTSAQWVRKADGLKPRSELGETVVYNSKLYAFAGFSDSLRHAESTAEVYDPATNVWTYIASMPANTAMTHQDIILIDNTVWHIGGRVGQNPGSMSSAIWIYNITNNTWYKGPEILDPATGTPLVMAATGSALLGRVLHIFGGFTPTACTNDQVKYHLTLDVDTWLANPSLPAQWENKFKPMPLKRNHISAVVLGGKIYAFGGQLDHDCGTGNEVSYCQVYNPATDVWTQLTSLPTGRSHAEGSSFAMDGKIYMVGGQGSDGKSSKYVTTFDPAANNGAGAWTENTSLTLPYIYEGLSARIIGSTFIVSHGSQGSSRYPAKQTYTRTISRNPVYKFGFPAGCLNLNDSSGSSIKAHSLLFTIDSAKTYTTSSNASWLTVSKNANGTATQNGADIEVTANSTGLAAGTYNAQITATGTGGGTNFTAATLCVSLTVQPKTGPLYSLVVNTNGIGSVTKSPDLSGYNSGAKVVLTAVPANGQQFSGWSGDTSGMTNPITITMNSAKTITASFTPVQYTLSVTASGSGTVSKNPNQAKYNSGTDVTLTANPASGQQFNGWSGSIISTSNPIIITVDTNKSITASFAPIQYNLTVTTAGSGSVTTNPNQTSFSPDSAVTLTATPAAGEQFTGWSGSASGTVNPLTITMDASKTVTANFTSAQYNLTVTTSGSGTVTKSPDQTAYNSGTSVTLTASPAAGQKFTGWSGSSTGTANPLVITMTGTKNITANFQPITLITNLTTTSTRSYVIGQLKTGVMHYTDRTYQVTSVPAFLNLVPFIRTPNDDKGSKASTLIQFNLTQSATLYVAYDPRATALPAWLSGWQKISATLGITDSKLTYLNLYSKVYPAGTVSLGGNLVSPAAGSLNNYLVLGLVQYNLTVIANGSGTVTKSPNQNTYNSGTTVTLTATPSSGQVFTGWDGSASGTANPLTITMNAAKTITANFSPAQYSLTVNTNGKGSVAKNPDQANYNHGSAVTISAVPSAGQRFTGWSGSASGSDNPFTITMNAAKTITASFAAVQYSLSVNTNGNGSITKDPDQLTYDFGSATTLTATPAPGQQFTGWSGDVTGINNPLTVTMDADKIITANFSPIQYTLIIKTNGQGSVTKNPDQLTYDSALTVTLSATPDASQQFKGWSGDTTSTANPLTVTMNTSKIITADFSPLEYNVTISVNGNGSVTKNPDKLSYPFGSFVTLTATPDANQQFTGWSGDATGTDNPYTITVTGDQQVNATFIQSPSSLTRNSIAAPDQQDNTKNLVSAMVDNGKHAE